VGWIANDFFAKFGRKIADFTSGAIFSVRIAALLAGWPLDCWLKARNRRACSLEQRLKNVERSK